MAEGVTQPKSEPQLDARPSSSPLLEVAIEKAIFASRWLMAPVYLGLILCLAILIYVFFRELWAAIPKIPTMDEAQAILLVLTLIDLSLAGNLVLIILFSGYENFVSKIEAARGDKDRPEWMGTLDFSGLKIKLIASIVAISGIHLLKIFMDIESYTERDIYWIVVIHMVFVFSGVAFAAMDWIKSKTKTKAKEDY
jgi:uncharacterized protein (TIGR00645 family)